MRAMGRRPGGAGKEARVRGVRGWWRVGATGEVRLSPVKSASGSALKDDENIRKIFS